MKVCDIWVKLTLLLVDGLLFCAGSVRALSRLSASKFVENERVTYHHLLHLVADTHACDLLQVLQPSKNLMLNLELRLHAECSTFLDCEWLGLESLESTGRLEVDDNVGTALNFKSERVDDAFAGVVGVGDVLALAEAEGSFPLVQCFIVLVYSM